MTIAEFLITNLGHHSIILSLIAGFLSEDILLLLTVLSGIDLVPIWHIVLLGFLGVMIHDTIFYMIGRSSFINRAKERFIRKEHREEIVAFIHKYGGHGYFIPLVISKFVYGIRVAAIFYAAHKESNYVKYTLRNALAVALWFLVMIPLGWLAGLGFSQILHVATKLEKLLLVLLIVGVMFYIIRRVITPMLKK